jgi:hypothetical protein
LLSDDGPPQVFSAELLAGLLKEAKEDKTRIADMEKQLDDMSVQWDENDRLLNEKKELLKGFGVSAGESAMDEKERDAISQLTGVVVALANEVRNLKAGEGELSAAIARQTTGSSISHNVVSESLKIYDVMKMFQMHLKPVQVHRPGEANFPAARRCWTRVARSLTLSPEHEASTVGMAFTGPAATVYEKVLGDSISATAVELWEKMEKRLYNDAQVQAQRSKFHTARLGTNETIEDFPQRIRDLGTGLPEAAEYSMILQRFREGLTTTLKLQSLAISAGFDEVVSRVSQMSEVQGKRRQPEWVNEVREESAFSYDASAPPG